MYIKIFVEIKIFEKYLKKIYPPPDLFKIFSYAKLSVFT